MKTLLLCAFLVFATVTSFALAEYCSYGTSTDLGGSANSTFTHEFMTLNGDCCNPTAGSSLRTWTLTTSSGFTYTSTTYESSSDAAAGNPFCNGYYRRYD
jgi:hypothetical protein